MRKFDIPPYYRSSYVTAIKNLRRQQDTRKKDFSPTRLDFGPVRFYLARHFGFCFGVENAIEIAYRAIDEHPDRRIFLLSEMIHNPDVNADLQSRGVRFLMKTNGDTLVGWDELTPDDIVIVPAFGTTIEIQEKLNEIGIDPYGHDTTCPFVEKVWNKASQIGNREYTVVVHGKPSHEETRATFSHSRQSAPTVVVRDLTEAQKLAEVILGHLPKKEFFELFREQYSEGFDPEKHLDRIGVVNQTTMLASDTQEIADYLKQTMQKKFGVEDSAAHFADTRDTLCYATNDNQNAVYELLKQPAHLAIVAGGYNSSNTSHLVELCEQKLATYYISSAEKVVSANEIMHYDLRARAEKKSVGWLPNSRPLDILVTCGASCPDSVVERIIVRVTSLFEADRTFEDIMASLPAVSA